MNPAVVLMVSDASWGLVGVGAGLGFLLVAPLTLTLDSVITS